MYLRQASALAARRATAGSVRKLATGKDVKFGVEGRALMLQGVDMLADAVQVRGKACGYGHLLPACDRLIDAVATASQSKVMVAIS